MFIPLDVLYLANPPVFSNDEKLDLAGLTLYGLIGQFQSVFSAELSN
jgi:hypothetical protein